MDVFQDIFIGVQVSLIVEKLFGFLDNLDEDSFDLVELLMDVLLFLLFNMKKRSREVGNSVLFEDKESVESKLSNVREGFVFE